MEKQGEQTWAGWTLDRTYSWLNTEVWWQHRGSWEMCSSPGGRRQGPGPTPWETMEIECFVVVEQNSSALNHNQTLYPETSWEKVLGVLRRITSFPLHFQISSKTFRHRHLLLSFSLWTACVQVMNNSPQGAVSGGGQEHEGTAPPPLHSFPA